MFKLPIVDSTSKTDGDKLQEDIMQRIVKQAVSENAHKTEKSGIKTNDTETSAIQKQKTKFNYKGAIAKIWTVVWVFILSLTVYPIKALNTELAKIMQFNALNMAISIIAYIVLLLFIIL